MADRSGSEHPPDLAEYPGRIGERNDALANEPVETAVLNGDLLGAGLEYSQPLSLAGRQELGVHVDADAAASVLAELLQLEPDAATDVEDQRLWREIGEVEIRRDVRSPGDVPRIEGRPGPPGRRGATRWRPVLSREVGREMWHSFEPPSVRRRVLGAIARASDAGACPARTLQQTVRPAGVGQSGREWLGLPSGIRALLSSFGTPHGSPSRSRLGSTDRRPRRRRFAVTSRPALLRR